MFLSKPFLINRLSSPTIIFMFINQRVSIMADYYYLDDTIMQETIFGPVVIIKYAKFNI